MRRTPNERAKSSQSVVARASPRGSGPRRWSCYSATGSTLRRTWRPRAYRGMACLCVDTPCDQSLINHYTWTQMQLLRRVTRRCRILGPPHLSIVRSSMEAAAAFLSSARAARVPGLDECSCSVQLQRAPSLAPEKPFCTCPLCAAAWMQLQRSHSLADRLTD